MTVKLNIDHNTRKGLWLRQDPMVILRWHLMSKKTSALRGQVGVTGIILMAVRWGGWYMDTLSPFTQHCSAVGPT